MNLCQPDGKKGCSACCGLFNFKNISRENLHSYLNDFNIRQNNFSEEELNKSYDIDVRDIGTYICPYAGYVKNGCPGCMIHSSNSSENMRDISFYGEKICSSFVCAAHNLLNDEYKNDLIKYVDDWLLYTTAIIDPESFIWISDLIHADEMSNNVLLKKKQYECALQLHYDFLSENKGPIFFYSISEYNLNKKSFSLQSNTERVVIHRNNIINNLKLLEG